MGDPSKKNQRAARISLDLAGTRSSYCTSLSIEPKAFVCSGRGLLSAKPRDLLPAVSQTRVPVSDCLLVCFKSAQLAI